jgi:hypothetical protein
LFIFLLGGRVELAAALLSELARTLGQRLGPEVRAAFGRVLGRLAELAPLAGTGVDLMTGLGLGRLASSGSPLLKRVADRMTSGPSLEELRSELKRALRVLVGQQVLVVVDDVDRLTPQEALEMMTVVKGLGDLPNVVYVLIYDEERLVSLVNSALSQPDGGTYVEKIVQYSVQLPLINIDEIASLFEMDFKDFFESLSSSELSRFRFAWNYFMRHYILTPRDVKRLINHYYFARSALEQYTDPIDLLILEVIRLHEPSAYSWLRANIADVVN